MLSSSVAIDGRTLRMSCSGRHGMAIRELERGGRPGTPSIHGGLQGIEEASVPFPLEEKRSLVPTPNRPMAPHRATSSPKPDRNREPRADDDDADTDAGRRPFLSPGSVCASPPRASSLSIASHRVASHPLLYYYYY